MRRNGHYTVYLPSFDERKLIGHLGKIDVRWELFSKHYKGEPYTEGNVTVYPVSYERFIESFTGSEGILTNAGFETPSEALFLGKKLLAVPMTGTSTSRSQTRWRLSGWASRCSTGWARTLTARSRGG